MDKNEGMAARYEREIPEGYEARIEGNKVIFEVKESEDERIRKLLLDRFKLISEMWFENIFNGYLSKEQFLAYLEKQKDIITDYEDRLDRCACDNFNKGFKAGVENQKKPKFEEWSEEDSAALAKIIFCIHTQVWPSTEERKSFIDFLKSLHPTWRPSEEQMKALEKAFSKEGTAEYRHTINSLYQDLKKLM